MLRERASGKKLHVVAVELLPGQHLEMRKIALETDSKIGEVYQKAVREFVERYRRRVPE